MGAWSEHTFGNDTAWDWAGSFIDNPGLETVQEPIDTVLASEDYLDSHEACECLAACEVIARLQGKWGLRDAYSGDLDRWLEANLMIVPASFKQVADAAIERILGPKSELPELWDEGGRNEKWHNAIDDLRKRVKG